MSGSNNIERMTVTVTRDMALTMREALAEGGYASSSEIVREALRDWQHKWRLRESELESLRSDIAVAHGDIAEGKVQAFDPERIVRKGQEKSRRG